MIQKEIAVLMTCHNRKNATLRCLHRLMNQETVEGITIRVYLVDDGCSDGTGPAVRKLYPEIVVLRSEGNLFWCGGMRLAFGEALKKGSDYYLWLNDDSMLYPNAIRALLDTSRVVFGKTGKDAIIVGNLQDAESGKHTYGGMKKHKLWRSMSLSPVDPDADGPKVCDVINGNCVLIPRTIATITGNLSGDFKHAAADFDYSLRAKSHGLSCWITPGYVGTCSRIYFKELHKNKALSTRARINKMSSPAATMRIADAKLFVRRHGGILWPILLLRVLGRAYQQWLWLKIHSKISSSATWGRTEG